MSKFVIELDKSNMREGDILVFDGKKFIPVRIQSLLIAELEKLKKVDKIDLLEDAVNDLSIKVKELRGEE